MIVRLQSFLLVAMLEVGGAVRRDLTRAPSGRYCDVDLDLGEAQVWRSTRSIVAGRLRGLANAVEALPDEVTATDLRRLIQSTVLEPIDGHLRGLKSASSVALPPVERKP